MSLSLFQSSVLRSCRSARAAATSSLRGPTSQSQRALSDQARSSIQTAVKAHPLVLFMKGTPKMPQCGFSRAVVQLLELHDVPSEKMKTYNCLEDNELRQSIKEFSEWPTIPQVYIDGEFMGGCDMMMEMHRSGELGRLLESKGVTNKPPRPTPPDPQESSASKARRPEVAENTDVARDPDGLPTASCFYSALESDHRVGDMTVDEEEAIPLVSGTSSQTETIPLRHRSRSPPANPIVANVVSLEDDSKATTLSFRVFLLGSFLGCTGAAVGQIFFFKSNGIGFNIFLIILVSYPMGKALERLLPNATISLTKRWSFRLNPGPFTLKEHLLIGVLASGASGSSYAGDIVAVQDLYYHRDIGHVGGLLLVLSTQLIGFGLAGMTYSLLVRPTNMVWPSSLVVMTMYNTLHSRSSGMSSFRPPAEDRLLMAKKFKFFSVVFVLITLYQFIPTVFAPTLSSIAVLCLINNRSTFMRVLGSAYTGVGMFSLSFDWAVITSISLQTPFYSSCNYFAGLVWSMWILVPVLWYFDFWNYQSFGDNAVSSRLFNSKYEKYDVGAVVKPDLTLDLEKYNQMGPIQLTPYFALFLTSAITTVILFHSDDIRMAMDARTKASTDAHVEMMEKSYAKVPASWYIMIGTSMTIAAIYVVVAYPLQIPVWGLAVALALALCFTIPLGIIKATSNTAIGLHAITELTAGLLFPGKPLANVVFKVYGYMTMHQCLDLAADLKLGIYAKIPPKDMFISQVLGTAIGGVVNYIFIRLVIADKREYLDGTIADPTGQWTGRKPELFYSGSVVWGLIGPFRFFSVFLHGSIQPPRQPNNIIVGGFICAYVSQYWALRKRPVWFHNFNYILSSALDAGTSINALIVYALALKGFEWWWNPAVDSEHSAACPPASAQESPNGEHQLRAVDCQQQQPLALDQPQPSEFTLITPSLQTQHDYPHPSNHDQQTPPPYDAFTSSDITPALQRLLAYWNTTTQQDPLPQREAREEEKAGADSGKTTSLKTRTLNSSKDGIMLSSIIRRRKNGAGRPGAARRRRKPNKIVQVRDSPTPHPILQEHGPDPRADPQSRTAQTTADHSLNKTLDGVGVGAVNMYLVVFRDGIISFHFENLQKHIDRVKERIHSFSTDTGHVSPPYGLMDSIVDEFFPVLELIEAETDKMEEYLLGGGGSNSSETGGGSAGAAERLKSDAMIERARMLTRITTNRRLVVSLARLIAQKHQTVEALRKRMSVDGFVGPTGGGGARAGEPEGRSMEIGLYLGDLQDHIVGLSQALSFYDTLLSNAHSAYLGILRVGLHSAKQAQDVIIIRLYLITLIVLPMNTLIGLHSMNIHIPANGDMENHRLADGSQYCLCVSPTRRLPPASSAPLGSSRAQPSSCPFSCRGGTAERDMDGLLGRPGKSQVRDERHRREEAARLDPSSHTAARSSRHAPGKNFHRQIDIADPLAPPWIAPPRLAGTSGRADPRGRAPRSVRRPLSPSRPLRARAPPSAAT
ncbi:hypothetical protein PtB15_14B174 [Puccinia triticina]|nr:hypothetical protein PtB15_14B174 [Puccinia triticina]